MPRFYSRRSYSRWTPRRYMRPARSGYQTKRIASQVNKAIVAQAEKKYMVWNMNAGATFQTIGTSWSDFTWSPATGVSSVNRIGSKIAITDIYFTGVLSGGQTNTSADDKTNIVRMVVALWNNNNNSVAMTTSPMAQVSLEIGSPIEKQFFPTMHWKLFDKMIVLNSPGRDSTGYIPPQKQVSFTKHFTRPVPIQYSATGDVPGLQWFISARSDSSLIPNPGFVAGSITLKWIDL